MFAREGYAGTKILDIVREAGVSTGAVYARFESKNDLLRAAVVNSSTRGGVLASGAGDVAELLRHPTGLIERPLNPSEALRLEAYVTARRDREVAAALTEAYEHWRQGAEPLVTDAMAAGSIDDDLDPEAVLFLYRSLYLGMLLHRGSGMDGPDPEAWAALVERLVASLSPPSTPPLPSQPDLSEGSADEREAPS